MLHFLVATEAECAFSAISTPHLGSCAGPTERARKLREAYPTLPKTMCPLNQVQCTINGSYDCYQCCPEFNRLNEQNENCPRSYVCGPDGICVFPNETAYFMKKCASNIECGQMKCIDGVCQLCRHGEWEGQLACVGGQQYGLGARPFVDPLQLSFVVLAVLQCAILLIEITVYCCRKHSSTKSQSKQ